MKATYIPTRSPNRLTDAELLLVKQLVESVNNENTQDRIEGILKLDMEGVKVCLKKLAEGIEPEKLAACLARYSRSNEGIEVILEKYADKSPDAIFKFVDYGHASIGGLTGGIAIAVDDISMLIAFKLFEFAQMADGQEASTRYITLNESGLPSVDALGIPAPLQDLWGSTASEGFKLYNLVYDKLDERTKARPELARLPQKALRNEKMRDRMLKNYALDRARYFLPFACKTNAAIVATARIWADTVRLLESLQWPEAIAAAELIRAELKKVAPNLVRHSHPDNASIAYVSELQRTGQSIAACELWSPANSATCQCRLEVFNPKPTFNRINPSLSDALRTRGTRYHHTGVSLKRQIVQAEWSAIAIAELRDLNRHRTGYRFSDFGPKGFYLPEETVEVLSTESKNSEAKNFFSLYGKLVQGLARQGQPGLHAYGFFLGTQVAFEHTQAADKFLYEVELRTGLGAHFRYAEHLKQAAELYFEACPETKEYIQIGEAEPE